MSDICRHACKHADCAMERGDELPSIVTAAYWPDGTLYVPRPEALARRRAREEYQQMEAAAAGDDPTLAGFFAFLNSANASASSQLDEHESASVPTAVEASTTPHDSAFPCSEPDE